MSNSNDRIAGYQSLITSLAEKGNAADLKLTLEHRKSSPCFIQFY